VAEELIGRSNSIEKTLGNLTDLKLLEEIEYERFQLHVLLRDYAMKKLREFKNQEEIESAKQRLIEYFLEQSARMKSQLDPDERRENAKSQASEYGTLSQKKNDQEQELELEKEAFAWFEKELPTLATIQAWISESKNWDKLIRLSLNLAGFLDRSSNLKFAEELHDQALYAADQLDNCLLERAKVLSNLGCVYQAQRKSQNALECHEKSLDLFKDLETLGHDCKIQKAKLLHNIGLDYRYLGFKKQAISCHEKSLDIYRKLSDRRGEATSLQGLGMDYLFLSNKEGDNKEYQKRAIDNLKKSCDLFRREEKYRWQYAISLNGLGRAYQKVGDWKQAISHHEISLDIYRELSDRRGEATSLYNLAFAYKNQRNWNKALKFGEKSDKIYEELDDPRRKDATQLLDDIYSDFWTHEVYLN